MKISIVSREYIGSHKEKIRGAHRMITMFRKIPNPFFENRSQDTLSSVGSIHYRFQNSAGSWLSRISIFVSGADVDFSSFFRFALEGPISTNLGSMAILISVLEPMIYTMRVKSSKSSENVSLKVISRNRNRVLRVFFGKPFI